MIQRDLRRGVIVQLRPAIGARQGAVLDWLTERRGRVMVQVGWFSGGGYAWVPLADLRKIADGRLK